MNYTFKNPRVSYLNRCTYCEYLIEDPNAEYFETVSIKTVCDDCAKSVGRARIKPIEGNRFHLLRRTNKLYRQMLKKGGRYA